MMFAHMAKRRTVSLTEAEYRMLLKARQYVRSDTGADYSFGALIAVLSCGVLAVHSASKLTIACPIGRICVPFRVLPGTESAGLTGPPQASGKGRGVSAPSRP